MCADFSSRVVFTDGIFYLLLRDCWDLLVTSVWIGSCLLYLLIFQFPLNSLIFFYSSYSVDNLLELLLFYLDLTSLLTFFFKGIKLSLLLLSSSIFDPSLRFSCWILKRSPTLILGMLRDGTKSRRNLILIHLCLAISLLLSFLSVRCRHRDVWSYRKKKLYCGVVLERVDSNSWS